MEYPELEVGGAVLKNVDENVKRFVDEWNDEKNHIIAHTSGSTGRPKEIMLLKSDMRESAIATCRFFGINNNSVMVLPLSVEYIAGKMMIVRAIEAEANLWIERPSNTPFAQDYGVVDLLPVVPSQVDFIISDDDKVKRVKNLLIGGGAVHEKLEQKIIKSGVNAYVSYGMTETCSHVALRKIGDRCNCYNAMPGISFDVDDRGCLVINAPKFSFKKLVTNDVVSLIDKSRFCWLGRWDNVVNTGGVKVFPETIEEKISSILPHNAFYIKGRKSEKWGEELVLYVECGDSEIDVENLMLELKKKLNRYEVPKEIIPVVAFSRTDSGKIKR